MIELKHLEKKFHIGDQVVHALDDVSLRIEQGEYIAVMGPSGSGKSTLMNIIGCLDTPSKGIYSLNGTNVSDMSDDDLASIRNVEIGFVFQSFNLLPRTSAIENVSLPLVYAGISKNERMERAQKALEKVGLGDRADHKPNELSGGQRQRVAIARALINNPSIVLADEPTGNLDSKSSLEIMNLFGQIHQDGNTVVMVTHEEDIAKYAKRTIRMIDGKLADQLIVN